MLHRILHNIKDDDATFEEHTQVGENYAGGRTSEKDQRRKNHKSGKRVWDILWHRKPLLWVYCPKEKFMHKLLKMQMLKT